MDVEESKNNIEDHSSVTTKSNTFSKEKNITTTLPVTIKTALQLANGELQMKGPRIVQLIIVGRILNIEEKSTRTLFTLEDTTGSLEIVFHKPTTHYSLLLSKLNSKKNLYLKAFIIIVPMKDKRLFITHSFRNVKDYNEITYHLLNCFLSFSQRTEGYKQHPEDIEREEKEKRELERTKKSGLLNQPSSFVRRDQPASFLGQDQSSSFNISRETQLQMISAAQMANMTMSQKLIINGIRGLINQPGKKESGVSVIDLLEKFGEKFSSRELRSILTELLLNGDLYTINDEDHFYPSIL